MSEPSSQTETSSFADLELDFTVKQFEFFDVEYAEQGNDIIYHFWPPNDGSEFGEGFAKALENGYKKVLPEDADVRAEYTDLLESKVLLRYGESADTEERERETYYIRVVGWADNPMKEKYLMGRVFENIETEMSVRGITIP
jgi:hypothetical protein